MQQTDVDMQSFLEADGLKHLVVCINYFSEWSKPIKDKRASTIAYSFMRLYVGMDV